MKKLFGVVITSLLLTVFIGLFFKINKLNTVSLISPLTNGVLLSGNSQVKNSTINTNSTWQIYVNNQAKYKIKHPPEISLVNQKNGDVDFIQTEKINIHISQQNINKGETLETIVEKIIYNKELSSSVKFVLTKAVLPIALGQRTALTFSSSENDIYFDYYFIPQNNNQYLEILNRVPVENDSDYLTSEKIIYSIEEIN